MCVPVSKENIIKRKRKEILRVISGANLRKISTKIDVAYGTLKQITGPSTSNTSKTDHISHHKS